MRERDDIDESNLKVNIRIAILNSIDIKLFKFVLRNIQQPIWSTFIKTRLKIFFNSINTVLLPIFYLTIFYHLQQISPRANIFFLCKFLLILKFFHKFLYSITIALSKRIRFEFRLAKGILLLIWFGKLALLWIIAGLN